jgi:hypothetical protein
MGINVQVKPKKLTPADDVSQGLASRPAYQQRRQAALGGDGQSV